MSSRHAYLVHGVSWAVARGAGVLNLALLGIIMGRCRPTGRELEAQESGLLLIKPSTPQVKQVIERCLWPGLYMRPDLETQSALHGDQFFSPLISPTCFSPQSVRSRIRLP